MKHQVLPTSALRTTLLSHDLELLLASFCIFHFPLFPVLIYAPPQY
uniref:Uncharacterized protein n=1 Tax=Utricularia reniformis TaxID=192314 RepID=A0A1Y0B3E3_9LAMI|nr:hypothetical protein AEK19_MT1687 [Utricularia reniformis]ART31869.1 hypothetical protein AEK19_MT1687 [Utricularia reniformis]